MQSEIKRIIHELDAADPQRVLSVSVAQRCGSASRSTCGSSSGFHYVLSAEFWIDCHRVRSEVREVVREAWYQCTAVVFLARGSLAFSSGKIGRMQRQMIARILSVSR